MSILEGADIITLLVLVNYLAKIMSILEGADIITRLVLVNYLAKIMSILEGADIIINTSSTGQLPSQGNVNP